MAYSEELAARMRATLPPAGVAGDAVREQHMFGGLSFMVNGNMCCGVTKQGLMVRVGADAYASALERQEAREIDFTGRPLKGMVFVDAERLGEGDLGEWLAMALEFVRTLPAK